MWVKKKEVLVLFSFVSFHRKAKTSTEILLLDLITPMTSQVNTTS